MIPIRRGDLRHLIKYKTVTTEDDDIGGKTETPVTFLTCRAAIWPASAKELMQSDQLEMQTTHRIRHDWYPGILPSMKINHSGGEDLLYGTGDMEAGAGDPVIPSGWSNVGQEEGEASAMDTVDFYAGAASYDLNVNSSGKGIHQAYPTVINKVYEYQLWLKRISGSLNINWGYGNKSLTSGYADWTLYEFYKTATLGIPEDLMISSTGGAARWKIDNVGIQEVTRAFEIVSIINVEERNVILDILAKEF